MSVLPYQPPSANSNGQVYSTEENRIGTWIDGKPLYRRVVSGNIQDVSSGNTVVPNTLIENVKSVCYMAGVAHGHAGDDVDYGVPYTSGSNYVLLSYKKSAGVRCFTDMQGFKGVQFDAILEYTKTTD